MFDWILVLVLLILTGTSSGHPRIVHPRVIPRAELSRDRRSAAPNLQFVSLSEWILKTAPNEHLVFSPKFRIEGSTGTYEPIDSCETRQGLIHNREADSRVLLTRCKDDFFGLVSLDNRTYLVEPLLASNSSSHEHLLYEAEFSRTRRQASPTLYEASSRRFYNLTGDTFHEESYEGSLELMLSNLGRNSELDRKRTSSEEDVGYFFDRTWYREKLPTRKTVNKFSPPKWLELAIVADYSVIDFHGSRVQQYLLALLNIVSAIYKDPTLDSNMQLVIVRMILYSDKKDGMVQHGNARRSLENVNRWNRKLLAQQINETYDVAVWLTRLDIGGPSGYAPVSGVCDPSRSCALNRDEGLTSAFIIAHEVAHILGLSHDGDKNSGNTCAREAARGSIMAPMVAATFHNFHWSPCSRKEFHRKAKHWTCLSNRPRDETTAAEVVQQRGNDIFSMDEQCRMEFGEGYSRCRSVDVSSLCAHLWCGRTNGSIGQPCKTKKGPPLEGTMCDQNKWCKNAMCEPISREKSELTPEENTWGPWTECTRTCGTAVQYRTRNCAIGSACQGDTKEFRLCEVPKCPKPVDYRVQQCSRFFDDRASLKKNIFDNNNNNNNTWLPYEAFDAVPHCQLICHKKETGELFHTGVDLEDGTPCSYETTDICVDGACRSMGCDGVLGSRSRRDACGQCGGTNTTCEIVAGKFQRKLRRETTRLAVIPKTSHNVKVVVTILLADSVPHEGNMKILLRDLAQRRRYEVSEFDAYGRAPVMIIEGAAFRIERLEEKYVLWSRGPVNSEIVVSLIASREVVRGGASIAASWQFVLVRSELDRFRGRYSWVSGGPPGPCSAKCGGGVRRRMLLCRDDSTGELVARKRCQFLTKPSRHRDLEKCNTGSCEYTWIPGMWDRCAVSATSKSSSECLGAQQRGLYCVRASFGERQVTRENELRVYRNTVSPTKCRDLEQPVTERECVMSACTTGTWVYSEWSPCSQSCGRGTQTRKALCVQGSSNLADTSCNNVTKAPDETRACKSIQCSAVDDEAHCLKDKAHLCQVARRDLTVKCRNVVFRKRCCHSCRGK